MNEALAKGDIENAISYLNGSAKKKYRPVFEALLSHMPEIIASYSTPEHLSVSDDIAEYAVNRTIDGENHIFLIYFLRGEEGIWRLDSM